MKNIFTLVKKDFTRFRADKPAVILTFVVPIILIIIFGNIFGGGENRGKINLVLVNHSDSPVAKKIEAKLDSSDTISPLKFYYDDKSKSQVHFNEETAKNVVEEGKVRAALIIPENFINDSTGTLNLRFYYDPSNQIEISLIQGSVQSLIMTEIPDIFPYLLRKKTAGELGEENARGFENGLKSVVGEYFNIDPDSVNLFSNDEASIASSSEDTTGNIFDGMINFESVQLVGKSISNPGVTRIVGGWAIMFLLFSLTGTATSLFEEKADGTLKRILCMPVKRSQILWSKYIYSMLLGIVQLSVMFLFAWAAFDVDIFSNFLNLIIVIICSAAAAVSFGMIITSFAKSINQANGISTLLILVISALGGSWFPVSLLPDWMQILAKGTLTYWSVEAFMQVLWRGADFTAIAPHILVLLSTAFIANFYSLIRFRKGKIF